MTMDIKRLVSELTPLSHKQLMALAITQGKQLQHTVERDDIAIIGMHCITPGADSPDAFWNVLINQPDVFQDVRDTRFSALGVRMDHHQHPARAYNYTAGLIEGVDEFDPAFFGISPREARGMDPQQRHVLQSVVSALANAGYDWKELRDTKTGVFVGAAANEYSRYHDLLNPAEDATHAASGNAINVIAGRVAYTLGLKGPAIALDTACSSSLVALHMAAESVHSGDCDQALVSGVNLILSPATFMLLCQGQMLSPDGRCKTFDKDANGYVRSEAVCTVLIKSLSRAREDGDRILACIKGSAINQDGRSAGLTVPSSSAQKAVIEAALTRAKLRTDQIDYVECHGTGTSLGDPIEVQTLAATYANGEREPLVLGAAKSCIGHAEAASGLVGIIKAVLSLQHSCIPAQAHFNQWNPLIHVDQRLLQVPTQPYLWLRRDNALRHCAVSAFGFSGTNAHVILEEYPMSEEKAIRAPLPPISFNKQRYWWRFPVDPIVSAAIVDARGVGAKAEIPAVTVQTLEDAVLVPVANLCGVEHSALSMTQSLSMNLGFDSLMMSSLRDQLGRYLQHPTIPRIPLQLLFGEDTLADIVAALKAAGFALREGSLTDVDPPSCAGYSPSDQQQQYFSKRAQVFDAKRPARIARKLVHKAYDENVLVADIHQVSEKEYLAEMTQDSQHPYFYEHYLDHVPGLYVVEAVRQLATALCHLHRGVDFSHAFILNEVSVSFSHFIEIHVPAFIHLRITDETVRDNSIKLLEIEARVIQDGKEVAKVTGSGDVSSTSEYAQYRGDALTTAMLAAKQEIESATTPTDSVESSDTVSRVIACFDLDGTLTHSHTFWRFLLHCVGLRRFARMVLRSLPLVVQVRRGRMTLMQAREILIDRCLRGVSENKARAVAAKIADMIVLHLLRDDAIDALRKHQLLGHETYIVSNSAEYYLELLAQKLNINGVFGSRFEVTDGTLTGKLQGTHCQGQEKVSRLQSLIADRSAVKVYAYGDSSGDLAMLDWADYPFFKCF